MSIFDVSKLYCKNSYITSILVKKKFVDDPKDTAANIFIIFLANLGKVSYRKGNLAKVNHSPSFYLRDNYPEYKSLEVLRSISVPVTILKSIGDSPSSR